MANVALLATVGDLAASQTAGGISALLPSGTILPFGGASAPTGWLLCNGATISRTTYANLFAAISTAHGSGDGSTTFHLPDLRGRFMRGVDGAVARDPDRAARTAANSGGNTGDNVGSVQGNATAKNGLSNQSSSISLTLNNTDLSHTHNAARVGTGIFGIVGSPAFGVTDPAATTGASATMSHAHSLSSGSAAAQSITAGDNETRPLNANVNYIIKV
jgi:microcystin-dependent protein